MRPTLLLAVAGALTLVPAAHAVEFPFGSAVGSADYDLTPLPSLGAADLRYALCLIDRDGDGLLQPGDHAVLVTKVAAVPGPGVCPATLAANPGTGIVLNGGPSLGAGQEILDTHPLATVPLSAQPAHALRYVEDGSDMTKMDGRDTLYVDLNGAGAAAPRVDVGDLRIGPIQTAGGALPGGSIVTATDGDVGRPLANIRPAVLPAAKAVSTPNMVYKAGSGYYVNADAGVLMGVTGSVVDGDVGVESGDVRLNPRAANPFTDTAYVVADRVELLKPKVGPGEPFQAKVTVRNAGRAIGAGLVETRIGEDLVDARGTPSIEPNGVATLVLTLPAPREPGQYAVRSGTFADFLTVEGAAADAAASAAEVQALRADVAALQAKVDALGPAGQGGGASASLGVPGLAPTAALAALVALAVLARRRS